MAILEVSNLKKIYTTPDNTSGKKILSFSEKLSSRLKS